MNEPDQNRSTRAAATTRAMVRVVERDSDRRRPDITATEEPMEIRVHADGLPTTVAVTMRTPGHDFELAVGYLLTEGILRSPSDVREVKYCVRSHPPTDAADSAALSPHFGAPAQDYNVVTVDATNIDLTRLRRSIVVSSSCGICGTDSIEHLTTSACPIPTGSGLTVRVDDVLAMPDSLRRRQTLFEKTGGLHGVGLFRPDGEAVVVREDVGRHNAVDKVIGYCLLQRRPTSGLVLVVSGRVSFEIVQKAAMARLPVIVAVGAPTSLAIDAADRLGITLVGFVNDARGNVYTHYERVVT